MAEPASKPRAFKVMLPLILLFFVPLLAAIVLYFYFPQWIPEGRTNSGELVTPARPAPEFAESLKGRWSYVYLAGDTCAENCQKKLVQIRQIRLALNEKRARVQYVLLTSAPATLAAELKPAHPDLAVLAAGAAQKFFAPAAADALYLLDPHGNWLMTYASAADSHGIFKDIKKLLKLSNIG